MIDPLVTATQEGLYCEAGGFHIDPWSAVDRAIVTHAHSDHAHPGCHEYVASRDAEQTLRVRLGSDAVIRTLDYAESINVNGVRVSLHPAGHILGSAQIRLESRGHVCVVSGDYKLQPDPTCRPFELVRCHSFITESTFGLPIYRWRRSEEVFGEINDWWRGNRDAGRTSIIFAYSLGKAQRLLTGLDLTTGPIAAHGAVLRFLPAYEAAGVTLPRVLHAGPLHLKELKGRALIVAPPSAAGTPWLRKFAPVSTAAVSGWMQVRGARRWRHLDRGFVLSDHADWGGLLQTITDTGASHIGVTHGSTAPLVRWLQEQGYNACTIATRYGEDEESTPSEAAPANEDEQLLP